MTSPVSKIIQDDFQIVLNSGVKEFYDSQRNLTITLVAIGVTLSIGAIIAITYSAQLQPPIIPATFGLLLGASICITISPIRKDWTPYHEKTFFDKMHARFTIFESNDFEGLRCLLKEFYFDKLQKYAYIGPRVAEVYQRCTEHFQTNTLDSKRQALATWNAQFA